MSYLEIIQEQLKQILEFDNITIGKVKPREDVILLNNTGGKGFEKYKCFSSKTIYEAKVQLILFINDIKKAYALSDKIEEKLDGLENDYIFSTKKLSGPFDLKFDKDDRKVISINYIIDLYTK